MEKVYLRLLRMLWGGKGRSEPRDPQTELVHVDENFLFSTDGRTFTIAPNVIGLEEGAWGGSVTLNEFSGTKEGSPAKRLLSLLPKVKDNPVKHSFTVGRLDLAGAIRNMNCDTLHIEIRDGYRGNQYMTIYGRVEEDEDSVPVMTIVTEKESEQREIPKWFPPVERKDVVVDSK